MWNGFTALISLLLFPVELRMQWFNPTPLLQPHYRAFITPTSRSVPAFRLGTLASWFLPFVLLPCHRIRWFPQFHTRAQIRFTPPIRRPPPAQYPDSPTGSSQ